MQKIASCLYCTKTGVLEIKNIEVLDMTTGKKLKHIFKSSEELKIDESSKLILFSDCHRGDNGWADDFAHNQNLLLHALNIYEQNNFTYIELGDGDELWENKHFVDIYKAHKHVFVIMKKFYENNRFHMIHGNHDMVQKKKQQSNKSPYKFFSYRENKEIDLFPNIKIHEGLVLRYTPTNKKILLVHGHQGDFWSDKYWKVSRFFVRHFWKPLQIRGWKDPTSPASNFSKQEKVHNKLKNWADNEEQMLICGHTHRSVFPINNKLHYYNTGSCVHPRCITGIEIVNGQIVLINWWTKVQNNGNLKVVKDIIEGPQNL